MAEIEVPPYFLCPITLEIMKDPVTVSTGISYDRESIEKWRRFSGKNATCPVTKLPLSDTADLTPNIILRRLIQSWCALHPPTPVTQSQILNLFDEAKNPRKRIASLRTLRSIASSHDKADLRVMEDAGACDFLQSLIVGRAFQEPGDSPSEKTASEVALGVMCDLKPSESSLKFLVNGDFVDSLTRIMQWGSSEARANAVTLLKSMIQVGEAGPLIAIKPELLKELARVLRDQISAKASRAALKVLISACPTGRNRIRAVEAGTVKILIDILLDCSDKRASEMILVALDLLCQCAEGRAELLQHGGGLAVVTRKILRISQVASERGVGILYSISKSSASPAVLAEMLQIGVVTKLCLVLQVDCSPKTKKKAREMLLLHARSWRKSPCIPENLVFLLYPSR